MVQFRAAKAAAISSLLSCALVVACGDPVPVEVLDVSLANTETFEHAMAGGEEEGAMITTEPGHAEVSEIRRGPETNMIATYVYQPAAGYVGADYVQIEIHSSSDGVGPSDISRLTIRFDVHE